MPRGIGAVPRWLQGPAGYYPLSRPQHKVLARRGESARLRPGTAMRLESLKPKLRADVPALLAVQQCATVPGTGLLRSLSPPGFEPKWKEHTLVFITDSGLALQAFENPSLG